jgi:hypothetical protein
MAAVLAAYPVHDQFKDTTFATQWGHVKEPPLPALENDIPAGARTAEIALSTDFRFGDDMATNVLCRPIFSAQDGEGVVL